MRIKVKDGLAEIRMDMPVFFGTTGKNIGGFPQRFHPVGTSLNGFKFRPEEGDWGTLVFDRADKMQRTPLSPIFFQYWWEKNKLVVREGLDAKRLQLSYECSETEGFRHMFSTQSMCFTGDGSTYLAGISKVAILDFVRLLEGKIDRDELEKRALKK